MGRRKRGLDLPRLDGVFAESWEDLVGGRRDQLEAIWALARTELVRVQADRRWLGRVRVKAVVWPELGQRRSVEFLVDPGRGDGGVGGWMRGLAVYLPSLGMPLAGELRLDLVSASCGERIWREEWKVEIGTVRQPGDPDVREAMRQLNRTVGRVTGSLDTVVGCHQGVLRGSAELGYAAASAIEAGAQGAVSIIEQEREGGLDIGQIAKMVARGVRDVLRAHAGSAVAEDVREAPGDAPGGRYVAWQGQPEEARGGHAGGRFDAWGGRASEEASGGPLGGLFDAWAGVLGEE